MSFEAFGSCVGAGVGVIECEGACTIGFALDEPVSGAVGGEGELGFAD